MAFGSATFLHTNFGPSAHSLLPSVLPRLRDSGHVPVDVHSGQTVDRAHACSEASADAYGYIGAGGTVFAKASEGRPAVGLGAGPSPALLFFLPQAWLSLLRRTLPFKKGDTFHKLEFKVAAMKKVGGSLSASPTACALRGYWRAGTQNDRRAGIGEAVILRTGTPIPAQCTCHRRCRDAYKTIRRATHSTSSTSRSRC